METSQEMMETDDSTITDERLTLFKKGLQKTFRDTRTQALGMARVINGVNSDNSEPFSQGEIRAALEQMSEQNQVMLNDDIVFLI